ESSLGRANISLLLQPVQDGVQRAGAQSVPVSGEFFDHRKPIEQARKSVMQKVQANQTTVEPASVIRGPYEHNGARLAHDQNLRWTSVLSRARSWKALI